MPLLANPRHELFCQAIAWARPAMAAYKFAGYKSSSAKANVIRLMENDGICSRVAELRAQQGARAELSRDQFRQFLINIIQAKPEQASMLARLVDQRVDEEAWRSDSGTFSLV